MGVERSVEDQSKREGARAHLAEKSGEQVEMVVNDAMLRAHAKSARQEIEEADRAVDAADDGAEGALGREDAADGEQNRRDAASARDEAGDHAEEADGEPRLFDGNRELGAEWTTPGVTVSLARRPSNLHSLENHGYLHGQSIAMRRVLRDVRLAAPSDASVLIRGETGTGKELLARTLHDLSPRAGKPYVVIDCTAVSETLFESELFGHIKGSFSGATANREGPFEEADGGTVFIDEIGEIPLAMQPKLLRVLESGTVRRVGENTHRKVDVRVVAATHRDLQKMVQDGTFRGDLYYRLAVLELKSPPLRERHGDLAVLLRRFVGDERFEELTDAQWEAIESFPWTGNIRELRNFAQRAAVHGWNGLFDSKDDDPEAATTSGIGARTANGSNGDAQGATPREPTHRASSPPAPQRLARASDPREGETLADYRARWVSEGERHYLRAVLEWSAGNVTKAAKLAGIDRSHFHRVMKKCGLGEDVAEG